MIKMDFWKSPNGDIWLNRLLYHHLSIIKFPKIIILFLRSERNYRKMKNVRFVSLSYYQGTALCIHQIFKVKCQFGQLKCDYQQCHMMKLTPWRSWAKSWKKLSNDKVTTTIRIHTTIVLSTRLIYVCSS